MIRIIVNALAPNGKDTIIKVFIIGIAGRTGSRIARLLLQRGDSVGGLCREPEQLASVRDLGASGVLGDVATMTEQDLSRAVADANVIVFSAGAGEQDDDSMIDAVDYNGVVKAIAAARSANVSRLLLISVFPQAWRERHMPASFEHYMLAKKKADVALARSPLEWMILRPAALNDRVMTGSVSLGLAEMHTEISRDDLAATVAELVHAYQPRRILELSAGDTLITDAIAGLVS